MSEIAKFLEILFSSPSSPISASKAMEVKDWWDKAKIQYADKVNTCGVDEWISVDDRFPEIGQQCLIEIPVCDNFNIENGKYKGSGVWIGAWCDSRGNGCPYKVTRWMPRS